MPGFQVRTPTRILLLTLFYMNNLSTDINHGPGRLDAPIRTISQLFGSRNLNFVFVTRRGYGQKETAVKYFRVCIGIFLNQPMLLYSLEVKDADVAL